MKFPVKSPELLMRLAPNMLWHLPRANKVIYLTFDDGPHPSITREVYAMLHAYNAKATFFCVGANVDRYPDVVEEGIAAGHHIGNHTFHHMNGWKNGWRTYLENVSLADHALQKVRGYRSGLFRPPYGKVNLRAWHTLRKQYVSVMWDVVAGDWVKAWPIERVKNNVLSHAQAGSIVVLHDSEKSAERMIPTLAATLAHFAGLGYQFEAIPYPVR